MKKLAIIISFMFAIQSFSFAQLWNIDNAKYSFHWDDSFTGPYDGIREFTKHSDTLINNYLFTRYYEFSVSHWSYYPFTTSILDTTNAISRLAFAEIDSVVLGYNVLDNSNAIDTIYNFKAKPGESWRIRQEYMPDDLLETFDYVCDSFLKVIVIDTGHVNFQGVSLYFLHVEFEALDQYSSDTIKYNLSDTIFERFGSKGDFNFMNIHNYCSSGHPLVCGSRRNSLRCYSDKDISFGNNCHKLSYVSDENEIYKTNNFKIFPNPSANFINIESDYKELTITDLSGRICLEISLNQSKEIIDISSLSNGIYLISDKAGNSKKLIVRR
jgi:hypothetical protein